MVFGSFNKMMNKILSGETGERIARGVWKNTIEAPLRILEYGYKLGITPPGLTKLTDKVLFTPLRDSVEAIAQKGKK